MTEKLLLFGQTGVRRRRTYPKGILSQGDAFGMERVYLPLAGVYSELANLGTFRE